MLQFKNRRFFKLFFLIKNMLSKNKKVVFLIALPILLFSMISFVSADCSSDQIIMRISAATNAHGELWNGAGGYSTVICYSTIFGYSYTGTNQHDCTGTNKVVGLSASTNAHAEKPESTSYGTTANVCYGALQCQSASACPSDYKEVVRLYSDTNAHLESTDGTGGYSVKICCKGTVLKTATWTDMTGTIITTSDLNDTVKLVVLGEGMEGSEVDFTVYKDVAFWWDTKIATLSGIASTMWQANQAGNFYFKAKIVDTSQEIQSGTLAVSSSVSNTPPVAVITKPANGALINMPSASVSVSFGQASYDSDDTSLINYTWDFGDGNITILGAGSGNTTHNYTSSGPKYISLTVKDARGSTSSTDEIGILLNGTGNDAPLAIISNPENTQHFSGGSIWFNGTLSKDDKTPFENLTFTWEFDTGTPYIANGMAGAYFEKTFSAGDHYVILTVNDNDDSS